VATTDTRIVPSKLSSKVAPTMMLASGSTSSRMRLAAWSTSKRVRSLPPVIEISTPRAPRIETSFGEFREEKLNRQNADETGG
jgi:hypothetical protein